MPGQGTPLQWAGPVCPLPLHADETRNVAPTHSLQLTTVPAGCEPGSGCA
jgi:hypothetical protein